MHKLPLSLAMVLVLVGTAQAQPFQDVLVQSPSLAPPQRGSLAGTLSRRTFGAGDLTRGTFKLPLPVDTPDDRGPLLAGVVPTYSPESGITEWGMGWEVDLAIRRSRPLGEIDFSTDDFAGPWGRLVAGDDGYYPAGLTSTLRVVPASGGWVAQASDGTRYTFAAADAVTTSRGTFQWMLSRVDNLLGDSTTLQWRRNASGRPFLSVVQWGGRNEGTQYRMTLEYEAVPRPFVSYVSGERRVLDQRVAAITVGVKQGAGYVTRWRYRLAYQESSTGPAFYLRSITKSYASGQSEPPVVYDYDLGDELRAAAQFAPIPALAPFLVANGGGALQPDQAALTDLDQDGLVDVETAFDQMALHQTQAGFVSEPLPAAPGADPACRPPASLFNRPRTLARMHGDATEPQVVWIEDDRPGVTSRVLVCDRRGATVYDQSVAGSWVLDANTRLADLDMDQRPDLVRVSFGAADVLRNTSAGPRTISFAAGPTTFLWPQFTPTASWVLDVNGDGRTDLVSRFDGGVVVWLGLGGGLFDPIGTTYGFDIASGPLPNFASYQFSFGDFNGDGLADAVLTQGQSAHLFTNRGDAFVEVPVPALQDIPWLFAYPLVADLSGSGNEEAVFVSDTAAMALDLTSASTGLLRRADDGKGTVLRFGYGRVAPVAGIRRRYAVLRSLTVESSGYDTVSYSYEYGTPVLHSIGKYLVGFAGVDKRSPMLTEHLALINDDDVSGVHGSSTDVDVRSPGIVRFSKSSYEDARFRGVRWLRPAQVEAGYRSADGVTTLSTTTQYALYERGFCPTVVVTTTPSGTLLKSTTLTSVAALPGDFHCLAEGQLLQGNHGDARLDFSYLAGIARNELGQVTRVTQMDLAGRSLVLQDTAYTADHRIARVGAPGRGTTQVTYDVLGRLAAITDPVGVVTQASGIDPVTDDLRALQTQRPGAPATAFFDYDGRERLQATWDDVTGASRSQPLAAYTYQDATRTAPARIDTQTLADAITGTSRNTVDLLAADGSPIVSGTWLGDHYSLGAAAVITRNTLTERHSFVGVLTRQALSAMTSSDVRALGTPLVEVVQAGFGHATQTTTTQQDGVVGTVTSELLLAPGELITRSHEPGGFTAAAALDAAGKLVRKTDQNGVTHRYRYDALGRLVRVDTPDGTQTVRFDGFGRPAQVTRDAVGAITYAYDATTGLVTQKQRLDASGTVTDTSVIHYDAIGRTVQIARSGGTANAGNATGTDGVGSADLAFDYDGQLDTATAAGQLGRLSRVRGDGWARSTLFDPLGRAYYQQLSLTAWRDVTTDTAYRADGSIASHTVTITDPTGREVFASTRETTLDSLGRVATVKIDGNVLYALSYDAEGRLARADFTSGEAIAFDYDPATHARRGHQINAPTASGGVRWNRDPRGLVADEVYTHDATVTRRSYDYDGRGALTRSTSGTDIAAYTYTASGLPDTISDTLGTRSVRHTAGSQRVGDTVYTWDAAGRVVGKADWTFDYGAHGQIARARRPGRQVDFVYDDADQRLLKRVDGVPVRADIGGAVLTEDHFVELIAIGGVVAGVLDNGKFTALLTDPRGTPFAGPDGTAGLATPYGVRASHLGYADVIDYARLGWDPDLDIVRMGVRDYDAKLGQFWTPDPLYFANLDKCAESPLQCSLYGYAAGNPISFVDPTGTETNGLMRGNAESFDVAQVVEKAILLTGKVAYGATCALAGCGTAGGGGDTWINDSKGQPLRDANGNWISNHIPTHRVTYSEQALQVTVTVVAGKLLGALGSRIGKWIFGEAAEAGGAALSKVGSRTHGGTPAPGTLSNEATRHWYHAQLDLIPSRIDPSLPLRARALQAFAMRNEVKLQARALMADRAAAEALPAPSTLQDVVQRAYQRGLRGDDIWQYVLDGSQRSNATVDAALGINR